MYLILFIPVILLCHCWSLHRVHYQVCREPKNRHYDPKLLHVHRFLAVQLRFHLLQQLNPVHSYQQEGSVWNLEGLMQGFVLLIVANNSAVGIVTSLFLNT